MCICFLSFCMYVCMYVRMYIYIWNNHMYIYIYARISVVGFPLVLSFLPVCHIPQTPKKHSVWQSSKIFGSWSVHRPIEFWGCKTVHMIIWGGFHQWGYQKMVGFCLGKPHRSKWMMKWGGNLNILIYIIPICADRILLLLFNLWYHFIYYLQHLYI